jgi:hypothetical protein
VIKSFRDRVRGEILRNGSKAGIQTKHAGKLRLELFALDNARRPGDMNAPGGKAGISAAMALRLAAALGTSPELWMNIQSQYDLWRALQVRQPAVRRFAHVTGG